MTAVVLFYFIGIALGFNFETFFEGNWTVKSSKLDRATGRVIVDEYADAVEYVVRKNDAGGLIGYYTPNERTVVNLKVEFADGSATDGTFLISTANNVGWSALFTFAFEPLSNKVIASRGAWTPASSPRGTYQFVVTGEGSFVLVVDDATSSTTLSAFKALAAPEQSFFQKYGMMIGMMIFMIVTQVMKSRYCILLG
jgi:hypothetical protein